MQVKYKQNNYSGKFAEDEMVRQDVTSFIRARLSSNNVVEDIKTLQTMFVKLVDCLSSNGRLTNHDLEVITCTPKTLEWVDLDADFSLKEVY